MTMLTAPADLVLSSPRRSRLAWAAADSLAIAQRNIVGMTRRPQLLAFVTIQPVLFVLMFRYVFGGSIHVPGVSYPNYLMAGIFVTTVLFGAQNTAIGMAEDLHNGLIERFRSLVMARSAVLAGRVLAEARAAWGGDPGRRAQPGAGRRGGRGDPRRRAKAHRRRG